MSTYGSDQKKINNHYLNTRSKELRYVLFVTDKHSSTGQAGYMRLNGQFGYVFKNAPPKTAAHELGHGIFKLEHPTASNTKLLMDYSTSEILSHKDWQQIGDPAFKFYGFQDQSEGEYKIKSLDYVCVNDSYFHTKNATYYDLDGNKISLKENYIPYSFVGKRNVNQNGIDEVNYVGRVAIIKNTETNKYFYPKASDKEDKHGYIGTDAYGKLLVEFEGSVSSKGEVTSLYADDNCEYFKDGKSIGIYKDCRKCEGLPKGKTDSEYKFEINKNTFSLPDELSVVASDVNEIKEGMPIIIDNDRRGKRTDGDTEDTKSYTNKLPSIEAEEIYKEMATLWNIYETEMFYEYLKPTSIEAFSNDYYKKEKAKLDNKKLLMPELISNGTLNNLSEQFLKDFFESKIMGYADIPYIGKKSLYRSTNKQKYEQAGSNLVQHFYKNTKENYYKTKTIADAIYKTETGKQRINDMIRLIDQVFQYQMNKPIEKINSKDFLKEPLDNAWFDKGIDPETFPSYGTSAFTEGINVNEMSIDNEEDMLALFCIGGTQAAKVVVKDFKPIIDGENVGYEATVILQYTDTFGVSEADYTKDLGNYKNVNFVKFNYRAGVMAQWVLQHQYAYQPFEDFLTYTIKMKKTWKK